ncbi:hypothetical protein ANCCAN_22213 [Ancylostoma caninum]|uniref:G-protein coupled receptors family 1 profile domain-containing protein n=1 Tax=Ancylostoma caninum TaxID=29170 RepID=A0A368FP73_ANCCA|nr:hypothetical protein ANCCAN_22213 [Ancylostoma caninum]
MAMIRTKKQVSSITFSTQLKLVIMLLCSSSIFFLEGCVPVSYVVAAAVLKAFIGCGVPMHFIAVFMALSLIPLSNSLLYFVIFKQYRLTFQRWILRRFLLYKSIRSSTRMFSSTNSQITTSRNR